MIKFLYRIYIALLLLSLGVYARMLPFYNLDDSYPEVKSIFEDHLSRKEPLDYYEHPREVRGWGLTTPNSQVTGIAIDPDGNPVIFHRGSRFWEYDTFNSTNHIQYPEPIQEPVVLKFDKNTGEVIHSWGADKFFLPHGITVDYEGNTWLTDLGAHQVYKFTPKSETASLILGEKFQPGDDKNHFCKPTTIAVASNGEFFVADGYCNARIIHFRPDGTLKGQYGQFGSTQEENSLNLPHGLALKESLNILCVADRENMRTVCVCAGLSHRGKFGAEIAQIMEPNRLRVFDVAFVGNDIVGVSGSEEEGVALGFTASLEQGNVIDQWEPIQGKMIRGIAVIFDFVEDQRSVLQFGVRRSHSKPGGNDNSRIFRLPVDLIQAVDLFHHPHSITVDETGRTVYVSEIGPNRVWKFILDTGAGITQA